MYQWEKIIGEAVFAPRDGAGALVLHDKMWLLGGWNPNDKIHFPQICNSEVWSSQDGTHWILENPHAPWEPRHCAGYVVHEEQMWIVGGDTNQGHHQNDVWKSANGRDWEKVCGDVPWAPRAAHYTVAFNGKIWVMGGQTIPKHVPGHAEIFYNDVWSTRDGVTWQRELEHAPWSQRGMIGGTAVFGNRIWLLGGGTYETPLRPQRAVFNEVWSTPDGVNWQQHANAAWRARQYHDVAVWDGKLWVLEGFLHDREKFGDNSFGPDDGNQNDVWFSADGETWNELPDTPWPPRHAASVFVFDGALWMVAGNNLQSDVWKLVRK
jgi:hypothetical protein